MSAARDDYLPAIEREAPAGATVDAAAVWLHGLGANGHDFAAVVPELALASDYGIRFVFPHAPSIPVTVNNGLVMPAWYDIRQLGGGIDGGGRGSDERGSDSDSDKDRMARHADEAQLRHSAARVHDLIRREIERGVAPARIIVAGFSQGGAVALQAAISYPQRLAGVMSLSAYFPTAGSIAPAPAQKGLPVLLCHGQDDPMVPEALGRAALEALRGLPGMALQPEYRSYPMAHGVCAEELSDISAWLRRTLGG